MQLSTLGCNRPWGYGMYTLGCATQIPLQGRTFSPAVANAPFQVCLSCRAASPGDPHLVSDLMGMKVWPFQPNAGYSWAIIFAERSSGLTKALSGLYHSSASSSAQSCFLPLPFRTWILITSLPQTLSLETSASREHTLPEMATAGLPYIYVYVYEIVFRDPPLPNLTLIVCSSKQSVWSHAPCYWLI